MDHFFTIQEAADYIINPSGNQPTSPEVVAALLSVEKTAKYDKKYYKFSQLIGSWQLVFITGTKKSQKRAGIVLGSGRYLPKFVKVNLQYSQDFLGENYPREEGGTIKNSVQVGWLKMIISGPAKWLDQKNILAFDFTRMEIQFFGQTLYQGFVRQGSKSEETFYQKRIGDQAFFSYFFVNDHVLAARGRGGGLALWRRIIVDC